MQSCNPPHTFYQILQNAIWSFVLHKSGRLIVLLFVLTIQIVSPIQSIGQGRNHQWLLGSLNLPTDTKGRALIDSSSFQIAKEFRKMPFKGTQANISDRNGNMLMYTNGIWITNATNDTMMNGGGINPNGITPSWPFGLPFNYTHLFLPDLRDTIKYHLFHSTITNTTFPLRAHVTELYYSNIDMTLDNGLGGVVEKNKVVTSDTIVAGIAACKHANGVDWWIIIQKDSSDVVYKLLLTKDTIIMYGSQSLGYSPFAQGNSVQVTFSNDGTQFITTNYDSPISRNSFAILTDFDRCSGLFSNTRKFDVVSGDYIHGLAFSASGEYVYVCTTGYIFQINTNTNQIDTAAIYDGFISPPQFSCCQTTFWNMYLAADGRIYVTSGSSVKHITVINHPDSVGLACDVQQHAIELPGNWVYLRSVPNHPNYELGPMVGSPCDSLSTSVVEITHDFRFSVAPNPNTGNFKIIYLLPQNRSGTLEIYDLTGRLIYSRNLPPWSTLQTINMGNVEDGLYHCVIRSGTFAVTKKVVVLDN